MRVIKPEVITEGVLTSSSIPEPDASVGEVEWVNPIDLQGFGSISGDKYASVNFEGFVYIVGSFGSIAKVDPLNKTVSYFGSHSSSMLDIINGGNGFLYAAGTLGQFLKIDPTLETITTFGSHSGQVTTLALAGNGFIYGMGTAGSVKKINPSTGLVTTFGTYTKLVECSKYHDSGFIYAGMQDSIVKIKISDDTLTEEAFPRTDIRSIEAGADGNLYVVGGFQDVGKIDTSTGGFSFFGLKANQSAAERRDDLISYNGDMYCVGKIVGGGFLLKINYNNKTVTEIQSTSNRLSNLSFTDAGEIITSGESDEFFKIPLSYDVDDKVIKTSTHTQYQCTIATNDDPEVGVDKIPQTWVKIGATNKWKVFDEAVNTQSTDDSPLVMEFLPGQNVTSIAGFNLSGASTVNITVTDPVAGEVYNKDIALISQSNVVDWFTYYWSPIISRRFFIATDLPPYINATIKVTITGSGSVGIGALVFGSLITIGEANYGTSVAMQDLSRLSEDDFGNVTVTRRESRKLTNYDVTIENARKDYVYNVLDDLRTIPSVWIGEGSQNDITVTYGYHYDLLINIDYPTICSTTLQVRGLV